MGVLPYPVCPWATPASIVGLSDLGHLTQRGCFLPVSTRIDMGWKKPRVCPTVGLGRPGRRLG